MRHPAPFESTRNELAAVQIEADVDADGPDRRAVEETEASRRTQVREIDIRGAREHVAGVDEADDAEAADQGDAQLAVQHDHAVAAFREAARADRPLVAEAVERKPPNGR